MAGPTRLELATSGVTGRRSNQLNYDPANIRLSEHRSIGHRDIGSSTSVHRFIDSSLYRFIDASTNDHVGCHSDDSLPIPKTPSRPAGGSPDPITRWPRCPDGPMDR